MPKIKTRKTAQKRIKVSKGGKLIMKKINTSHLKRKWSANKRHRKRSTVSITNRGQIKRFKKLLGKGARRVK